jgi:hypothetical protein
MTKTTQATVKIMISHDYSHFEVSQTIENENGILPNEVDNARKICQRLADKAVGQYKTAKGEAIRQTGSSTEMKQLEIEVAGIKLIPEENRSVLQKAKVKALEDYKFQTRYDYDDDSEYHPF